MIPGRAGGQSHPAGRISRAWRRFTGPAGREVSRIFARRDVAIFRASSHGFGLSTLSGVINDATDHFHVAVPGDGCRYCFRPVCSILGWRLSASAQDRAGLGSIEITQPFLGRWKKYPQFAIGLRS